MAGNNMVSLIDLDEKFELYKELAKAQQDVYGFIESHECDSLLFSSLLGCVQGMEVSIDAAKDNARRWHRRPAGWRKTKQCYDPETNTNREKLLPKVFRIVSTKVLLPLVSWEDIVKENWYKGSTISRDMILGLAWYAYHNKRLDISEGVIKYALKNWGVMGKGDPARVNIMPSLFSTFCWISYRLGGPSRPWARWIGVGTNKKLKDFQAHLQVLHILLREKLNPGGRQWGAFAEILTAHAKRQPNNPLFAYAVGDYDKAFRLLSDPLLWPPKRLPTRGDRKESWVVQRDYGSDWKPSTEFPNKIHSGADFIFCYSLLSGELK
jgi:hypothetical protein